MWFSAATESPSHAVHSENSKYPFVVTSGCSSHFCLPFISKYKKTGVAHSLCELVTFHLCRLSVGGLVGAL